MTNFVQVWSCHACRDGNGNYRSMGMTISIDHCPECQHLRCSYCYIQNVKIRSGRSSPGVGASHNFTSNPPSDKPKYTKRDKSFGHSTTYDKVQSPSTTQKKPENEIEDFRSPSEPPHMDSSSAGKVSIGDYNKRRKTGIELLYGKSPRIATNHHLRPADLDVRSEALDGRSSQPIASCDASMATDSADVTDLDCLTDSTDDDSVDLPDDPDLSCLAEMRVLNPDKYFESLEAQENSIFQNSDVRIHIPGYSKRLTHQHESLICFWAGEFSPILNVIKKERSKNLLKFLESHNRVHRAAENLRMLEESGYCSNYFPILVADIHRANVVRIVPIRIDSVIELSTTFQNMFQALSSSGGAMVTGDISPRKMMISFIFEGPVKFSVTQECLDILHHMGITSASSTFTSAEPTAIWETTTQIIELAILSYAGAHIERFDIRLFGLEITEFVLPRKVDYYDKKLREIRAIGDSEAFNGFTVTVYRRQLQCMDKCLGEKQPWVFHSSLSSFTSGGNEKLCLSSSIECLTDLWGPTWKVMSSDKIKQYGIGNGVIIPWSATGRSSDIILNDSEIFCHWIPSKSWNEEEVAQNQAALSRRHFLPSDILLIGARSDYGLLVNDKCLPTPYSISHTKTKLLHQEALRPPYTSRTRRYVDSHSVQIQGSAMGFVSGSGQITYKRRSGHTMKDVLVERWRHGLRNPVDLEAYSGVEISLCSRNARRRRLLSILSSNTMANYLNSISFSWVSKACENSYFKALRCPKSFRKFWKSHEDWRANVGDAISKCLDALEETGIDEDTQELSAFWVESFDGDGDSDGESDDNSSSIGQPTPLNGGSNSCTQAQNVTLPTPPDSTRVLKSTKFFEDWIVTLFRSEHTWTGFLQDSEDCFTMAVVGTNCLDFHDGGGFGRCCSRSGKSKGYPVLQTSIQINESILSHSKLKQEKVSGSQQAIWNAQDLKKGTTFSLGNHGSLEVISASSTSCPVIAEWRGVKSELMKEIKNVGVNEKLLGRNTEKHHREFIRGTWEVKPLPVLILSKSTKVRFAKD